MSRFTKPLLGVVGLCLILATTPSLGWGQGKSKHYAVSTDRAITVTREVLTRQGFNVVRIEREGDSQIVYYRRGNNGRGKGQGRLERMVIRREANRVVFLETPSAILVDIDIHLKL